MQEQIRDRGGAHGWGLPVFLRVPRHLVRLLGLLSLPLVMILVGCTNPNLPYVFYMDEDGERSLIDVCGEPLPRIEIYEVDADFEETGRVIGVFMPPPGSEASVVQLSDETEGYTTGVSVSDGTWASVGIVYDDGVTGLVVPWTDLPSGSGYTFQDEEVDGSLEEIVSSTRDGVQCRHAG